MKELKFNLLLLEKRKLIYVVACILILISLADVLLVYYKNAEIAMFAENSKSADYVSILNNPFISMAPLLVLGFPLLFSVLFSDTTWLELKQGNSAFLYTRCHYVKNIFMRYFLSVSVVFLLSCFCFLLNYISLSLIFGNGNAVTYYQDLPFDQARSHFFLDALRNNHVMLYSISLILHSSLLYGLLAGMTYSISFLFKNRLLIYMSSVFTIILFEFGVMALKLKSLSIMLQLQPLSVFGMKDALILYFILLCFGIGFLCLFLFKKKDLLL